jgi:hypothetical protein
LLLRRHITQIIHITLRTAAALQRPISELRHVTVKLVLFLYMCQIVPLLFLLWCFVITNCNVLFISKHCIFVIHTWASTSFICVAFGFRGPFWSTRRLFLVV